MAGRRIGVEIFADATKLLKAFSLSAKASNTFTKELTVDSRVAAEAQVRASVKTSESLRTQAAAYRHMAAAAERGSAEQVAAARLAERAELRLARSMGVTAAEATHLERSLGRAARGALSGSGVFRGFGRSIAFASGGFVAFQSATAFLRASIDAAREAQVAQRSLAAQMKASGQSFEANRERIDRASLSYGKFGFQNDEVIASLTVLERGTGSINKAIGLQGLTADIARAKNMHLADAAAVVAKVFGGQETALRRAVPGLRKNAHGWDLIREAQQKLAGQAAANTTEAERFAATLHNTEEIIGSALLPTLNKYLTQLSKWLDNTDNQEKIQKDATTVANDLATAFTGLGNAIGWVKRQWDKLPDFGKSHGLLDFWRELNSIGPQIPLGPSGLDLFGGGGGGKAGKPPLPGLFGPDQLKLFLDQAKKVRAALSPVTKQPLSLAGRFNLAELRLAQAQLTKTLADDRRILVVEKAIVEQQVAQSKSLKDRIQLTQQLAGIVGQIRGIDEQTAAAAKAEAEARKAAAQAAREAANLARANRQFRALGFGPGGADLVPGVAALQKRLASVRDKIQDSFLDTNKTRSMISHIRRVLSGGLGAVGEEVRAKIKEMLDGIDQQLKDRQARTRFRLIDPSSFVNQLGLGLTAGQKRRLELGLATVGPHGGVPAVGPRDFAGVVIHGDVHVHGVQDPRGFENELTKRQKGRPKVRRGAR